MEQQTPVPDATIANRGVYIALEGLANNHAELLKRLHAELVAANLPVKLLPPANQSDLTSQTLGVILEDNRYPKTPRVRSLLDSTTLASQFEAIRATTATGTHCLSSRGSLTHLVTGYYGLGATDDYAAMSTLVNFAAGKQSPTLTLVFDTPVDELTTQTIQSLALPVPADQQSSFLERIRAGYLWEANQHNFPVIFATSDTNAMFAQVWDHVAPLLKLTDKAALDNKPSSVAEVLAARPPQKTGAAEPPVAPPPTLSTPKSEAKTEAQPVQPSAQTSADQPPVPTSSKTVSSLLLTSLQPQPVTTVTDAPFDQKDAEGHYRYHIPAELKGKVRSQYIRTMNQLFENYRTVKTAVQQYTEKSPNNYSGGEIEASLQQLLPLAATYTVNLPAGTFTVPQDTYAEAVATGLAQQQTPPKDTGLQTLIDELLPPNYTPTGQAVQLVRYSPRNELDLTLDVVYPRTDLSFETLENTISFWSYEQKVNALATGLQTARAETLANAYYSFDLTTSFASVQALRSLSTLAASTHQTYTPRLGYDVPKLVEDAGVADTYEQCFDLSLELHSAIYAAKGAALAQYAVLHGHNVREKLTLSADSMLGLLAATTRQNNPALQHLIRQMHEQITEVHPLLAGTMTTA
ncbi:hypothetical protein EYC59_06105 [Candidatus Saccharibacteria bacterium]|nr:MAG: hypothetical protein EYC59_06105 [Candidatus Saccharibacteria bacterium]